MFTGSLEGGYPVVLGGGWSVEPQGQLVYQRTTIRRHELALDDGRGEGVSGRAGFRVAW